jgi:hypothetical protein
MRTNTILAFALLSLMLILSACGGPASTPNANTAANTANSTNPLETNKTTPEELVNNAPTLTPVFKAYCAAWQKNDEAAFKKVMSSDALAQYAQEMKEEKAKSLMKMLEASDKVKAEPCVVRNERITGDTAVATIVSSRYPNGIQVLFAKENGEWKLTRKSPAIDAVTKQAAPANAAK